MIVPLPSETVGTRLGSFMYQDEDVATLDIFDRSVHQGKQFSPYQDPPTFDLGARIVAYKGPGSRGRPATRHAGMVASTRATRNYRKTRNRRRAMRIQPSVQRTHNGDAG